MLAEYHEFLSQKDLSVPPVGIEEPPELTSGLFDFQQDVTRWALKRGRAAIFAGTGLGKSAMELAWADAVHRVTGQDVLVLAPLAVSSQMLREADKFGIQAKRCANQSKIEPGITVTNYQRLHNFDPSHFGAVVLDESSILKAMDSKTKEYLIEAFAKTPYRLAATATPAPNDYMELGNHAEFLGIMSQSEMLSTFFVHDGGETQKWRLKGHAQSDFWRWVGSWAVMFRDPSEIGYDGKRFELPPLNQYEHAVEAKADRPAPGKLIVEEAQTLQERITARRDSVEERAARAAEITPEDRPFVWWCNLNAEAEALVKRLPGAVEVRGSDKDADKERKINEFIRGKYHVLVTKPTICGHGLNFQHCADTGFVGLNDSWEQVYQAVRRFWRFGQTKPVNVHYIASKREGSVLANIRRKEAQAESMLQQMVANMQDITAENLRFAARESEDYKPDQAMRLPDWMR